jgi:hypothetical protein
VRRVIPVTSGGSFQNSPLPLPGVSLTFRTREVAA